MTGKAVLVAAVLGGLVTWDDGVEPDTEPKEYTVASAPAHLADGVRAASAAIDALQARLSGRLQEELKAGGTARAIAVCRDEAPALTAEVGRKRGVRVGRTSHRLRNPGNAAPAWAERRVAAGAGRRAASVETAVFDLGDRVGVLRPIAAASPCLACHGPAQRLSLEVAAFLQRAYPDDQAVGFGEGDLRGFAWAEAATRPEDEPGPRPEAGEGGSSDVARGRDLFGQANPRCTVCHSVEGQGNRQGATLDGVGDRLSRQEIEAWIRTPAEMARQRGSTRKPAMVPYPEFSDDELHALVAYLASLRSNPLPQ